MLRASNPKFAISNQWELALTRLAKWYTLNGGMSIYIGEENEFVIPRHLNDSNLAEIVTIYDKYDDNPDAPIQYPVKGYWVNHRMELDYQFTELNDYDLDLLEAVKPTTLIEEEEERRGKNKERWPGVYTFAF